MGDLSREIDRGLHLVLILLSLLAVLNTTDHGILRSVSGWDTDGGNCFAIVQFLLVRLQKGVLGDCSSSLSIPSTLFFNIYMEFWMKWSRELGWGIIQILLLHSSVTHYHWIPRGQFKIWNCCRMDEGLINWGLILGCWWQALSLSPPPPRCFTSSENANMPPGCAAEFRTIPRSSGWRQWPGTPRIIFYWDINCGSSWIGHEGLSL